MVMSFRVVVRDSSKGPPDDRARFGTDQRGRYTTLRGTTLVLAAGGPTGRPQENDTNGRHRNRTVSMASS